MKLIINGHAYDAVDSLQKLTNEDYIQLLDEAGIGPRTVAAFLRETWPTLTSTLDIYEDKAHLRCWEALVWIVRRAAGEQLSFKEANSDHGALTVRLESDAPEAEDPKAPKAPAGSEADGSQAAPA